MYWEKYWDPNLQFSALVGRPALSRSVSVGGFQALPLTAHTHTINRRSRYCAGARSGAHVRLRIPFGDVDHAIQVPAADGGDPKELLLLVFRKEGASRERGRRIRRQP